MNYTEKATEWEAIYINRRGAKIANGFSPAPSVKRQ